MSDYSVAKTSASWSQVTPSFSLLACFTQIGLIISYIFCTKYIDTAEATSNAGGMDFYYPVYQDVHVMIFIGFGFLMTYMHSCSFNAIGLNFFIAALIIQVAILTNGFWHNVHTRDIGTRLTLMLHH